MKSRVAKVIIAFSVLALALALAGCGSSVDIGKSVSGVWQQESMEAAGTVLPTSAMNITLDVKEDGTALLSNGYTGKSVDYSWKTDESKKSDSKTVYVIFTAGSTTYATTVNVADSTMLQELTGVAGGKVEVKYKKVS